MIKIYFPKHLLAQKRAQLFPFLKPFIKSNSFTDAERKKLYQISIQEASLTTHMKDADLVILPMSWNFYLRNNLYNQASEFVLNANKHGKLVWTFMSGDFGYKLNLKANYLVFRNSGHLSKLPNYHKGMPVFINDPVGKYFQNKLDFSISKNNIPIVGFCGQANTSIRQRLKEWKIRILHYIKFHLKLTLEEPQPIQSTSYLRAKILYQIENSKLIKDNFIKRKKYRAGIKENKNNDTTTKEFFNNIFNSQYVVAVRGGGNFSVRFYETLAMGRIPIFINTDCILPLTESIDWRSHCVWVEKSDINNIDTIIKNFHEKNNIEQIMISNRKLWESRMRLGTFFKFSSNAV